MRETYQAFTDLPNGIQHFMLHEVEDFYDKLIEDRKLSQDDFFDAVDGPILDSVMGLKTFDQAIAKVGEFLDKSGLDGNQKQQVIISILQKVFYPLRELFGNELGDFLKQQNIDTLSWPQQRVQFKPISYTGAVSELMQRLGLYSAGQKVRDKLRDIVMSLVKGTRVTSQVKEILTQSSDFGGLGFDDAMAEKAIAEIQDIMQTVQVMDEEQYRDYLTAEMGKTLQVQHEAVQQEERKEDEQIKTIKAAMPPVPKAVSELEKAVEATYAKIPDVPADPYLEKRLRNVISSRLRDVRNNLELVSLLERDSKVGGMGLEREASQVWSGIIEEAYREFRGGIEDEEKKKLETQLVEQKHKIEERRQQEAEEHAKWYEEKIRKRQSAETERKELAAALKKGLQTKAPAPHPLDLKNRQVEKQKFGELVPAMGPAAVSAAAKPTGKAPISAAPAQTKTVKVSAATAQLAQEAKPLAVDGVRAVTAPKLLGLIDELKGMTLAGFRRLGKTPQDATSKVSQRLQTLGEESFEQRVSGIRAWQTSPVMRVYMGLVAESFKDSKPIAQVAEGQRKAGVDTLTRDEIEALINLNNQLHF